MEQYKVGNATVRIHGHICREKLEEATISFFKKVQRRKEKKKNGNEYTSRTVGKKQVLDK